MGVAAGSTARPTTILLLLLLLTTVLRTTHNSYYYYRTSFLHSFFSLVLRSLTSEYFGDFRRSTRTARGTTPSWYYPTNAVIVTELFTRCSAYRLIVSTNLFVRVVLLLLR